MNRLKIYSILSHLFTALVTAFTIFYFVLVFNVDISVKDFFYDADTPRTLQYVNEPSSAISSIRPFLFLISWIPNLFLEIFKPYIAWSILNLICIFLQIACIKHVFREVHIPLPYLSFIVANFSVLCWTFVPDTFIIGVTFFLLGVVLYGDGSNNLRITLSGIVAASLNIFLFVPWIIAHILLGRKTLFKSLSRMIPALVVVTTMIFSSQYLQRFTPRVLNVDLQDSIHKIEPSRNLPFYDQSGIFASVDALGWIHSPFIGTAKNLLSFFSAPWTQAYSYDSNTWAIDSDFHPFLVLFLALALTLLSFAGIYLMKNEYRVFMSFIFSLEIATCLLFLTYGTHPYLYAPFLFVSRISGLIFFVRRYEIAFIPLILISATLAITSLQFIP